MVLQPLEDKVLLDLVDLEVNLPQECLVVSLSLNNSNSNQVCSDKLWEQVLQIKTNLQEQVYLELLKHLVVCLAMQHNVRKNINTYF